MEEPLLLVIIIATSFILIPHVCAYVCNDSQILILNHFENSDSVYILFYMRKWIIYEMMSRGEIAPFTSVFRHTQWSEILKVL